MAKALIGYLDSDPRVTTRLSVENTRLRARVSELETLVRSLSEENDRLVAAQLLEASLQEISQMQPA